MLDNKLYLTKAGQWFPGGRVRGKTVLVTAQLYMFVETHHAAPFKLMNISVYKVYFSKLIKEKKKPTEDSNSPFDLKKDWDTTHGN